MTVRTTTEAPVDVEKEFVSTVVPLASVPLYIGDGYEPVGYAWMDTDGIQKTTIRKRIRVD